MNSPASSFYVTGGRLRRTVFRKLEEWQSCEQALVVELDPKNNQSHKCVDYVSPPEVCADELPAFSFKSSTIRNNQFFTCTSTEVLVYELPTFQLKHYISLPCFNDLHHVYPSERGTILVAVTGLDMVVEITLDGTLVREWSVVGEDIWSRFSRTTDYRKVETTKPHKSHPNHVFEIDGEIWVTRMNQKDAICLSHPGPRIDIAVQRPHDGHVFGGKIYFTTVDGHIVVVDKETLRTLEVIDLNQMDSRPEEILGWCRGVLPIDDRWMWVGFTRVRPTKFIENVSWIKHGNSHRHRPSHIGLYDLVSKRCEQEIEMEPHGLGIIFSLLPVQGKPAAQENGALKGLETPVSQK